MSDREIEALSTVAAALADLDEDARERVLQWAAARYDVTLSAGGHLRGANSGSDAADGDDASTTDATSRVISKDTASYEHFAELFAAASPTTNDDRALVAAYWVQVHEGHDQWQARQLSTELKHLGHAIPNITLALTGNMRKKPQRVIQLKKSGAAKQATKTYKITNEGILHVQGMLTGRSA